MVNKPCATFGDFHGDIWFLQIWIPQNNLQLCHVEFHWWKKQLGNHSVDAYMHGC